MIKENPMCLECTRFINDGIDGDVGWPTCSAFPEGIPREIYFDGFDHTKPFNGDNGQRFVQQSIKLNYKCPKGTIDETNACGKEKPTKGKSEKPKGKSEKIRTKAFRDMSKTEFKSYIQKSKEVTFKKPEVLEAIENTDGAKLTKEGLELTIVRYQEPEQAGSMALRGAVFYLPEKNSPYAKYYKTTRNEYGGAERFEGKTVYRNPLIIKGATGGTVPERAYAFIEGKEKLKKMQEDIYNATNSFMLGFSGGRPIDMIKNIENVLDEYGGDSGYASEIYENTGKGNLRRYAVQEHIIAAAVKKAGYDGVIGFTKMKGKMHLSEVLDVRTNENPFQDNWEDDYESYYDDFYEDNIKTKQGSKG